MAQAKRLRAVEQNDSTEISTARARQTQARDGAANLGAMRQQPEAASELQVPSPLVIRVWPGKPDSGDQIRLG